MSIYVIGDLHLSFSTDKPMDIFGDNWEDHTEKIKENWLKKVTENDTVILPGDFSWATYLEESKADFEFLERLPGTKIILKGNHDYWWTTLKKMNEFLEENNFKSIKFLYNNAIEVEGYFDEHEAREDLCGDFDLMTRLTGYSEWTITGYDVETCTLGGHNLMDVLRNHLGEYVNIVIEAEEE